MIERQPREAASPRARRTARPMPVPTRVVLFRQPPEAIEPELPIARLTIAAIVAVHVVMLAIDPRGTIDAVVSILTVGLG